MIEETILNYLQTELKKTVYTEKPINPVDEYVLFFVTGINEVAPNIYSALLDVQSYSTSMYNASVLNEAVLDVMDVIDSTKVITHCSLNSSGVQNDLLTKKYRYESVFDITFYRRIN